MSHTPGPWHVDGNGIRALVRSADLRIVAVRHRLSASEHEANAALIAAAPDLLALLREARTSLADGIETETDMEPEFSRRDRDLVRRIDAALSKATPQEDRK